MPVDNAIYPNSRVAILSTKLLTADKFYRLADSGSLENAVKSLYEIQYGGGITLSSPYDFDIMLSKELSLSLQFFADMTPDVQASNCFILPYDYVNLKAIMKCKLQSLSYDDCLIDNTIYAHEDIINFVENGVCQDIPIFMQQAIEEINELSKESKINPYDMDTIIDRAMYKHILFCSKKSHSRIVKQYVQVQADARNLMCCIRLAMAKLSLNMLENSFAVGGILDANDIQKAVESGNYEKLLEQTPYQGLLLAIAEDINSGSNVAGIENWLEKEKQKLFTPHKNEIETVMPILCYFMSKRTEIGNLRLILVCLKNKVEAGQIKNKLKELYV